MIPLRSKTRETLEPKIYRSMCLRLLKPNPIFHLMTKSTKVRFSILRKTFVSLMWIPWTAIISTMTNKTPKFRSSPTLPCSPILHKTNNSKISPLPSTSQSYLPLWRRSSQANQATTAPRDGPKAAWAKNNKALYIWTRVKSLPQ